MTQIFEIAYYAALPLGLVALLGAFLGQKAWLRILSVTTAVALIAGWVMVTCSNWTRSDESFAGMRIRRTPDVRFTASKQQAIINFIGRVGIPLSPPFRDAH
jgi:hypothetical protein